MTKTANYSQKTEQAEDAVAAAEERLKATLMAAYPIGSEVRVIHPTGAYIGTVIGHDLLDVLQARVVRVHVRNKKTGNASKRWYRFVEIVRPCSPSPK